MYVRITWGQGDSAKIDDTVRLVPALSAALQRLPGCQDVQIAVDRRERLGEPLARLEAASWRGEPPRSTRSSGRPPVPRPSAPPVRSTDHPYGSAHIRALYMLSNPDMSHPAS
jgi:hypothetical protein